MEQITLENAIQYVTNAPYQINNNILNFDQSVNNLLVALSITNYIAEDNNNQSKKITRYNIFLQLLNEHKADKTFLLTTANNYTKIYPKKYKKVCLELYKYLANNHSNKQTFNEEEYNILFEENQKLTKNINNLSGAIDILTIDLTNITSEYELLKYKYDDVVKQNTKLSSQVNTDTSKTISDLKITIDKLNKEKLNLKKYLIDYDSYKGESEKIISELINEKIAIKMQMNETQSEVIKDNAILNDENNFLRDLNIISINGLAKFKEYTNTLSIELQALKSNNEHNNKLLSDLTKEFNKQMNEKIALKEQLNNPSYDILVQEFNDYKTNTNNMLSDITKENELLIDENKNLKNINCDIIEGLEKLKENVDILSKDLNKQIEYNENLKKEILELTNLCNKLKNNEEYNEKQLFELTDENKNLKKDINKQIEYNENLNMQFLELTDLCNKLKNNDEYNEKQLVELTNENKSLKKEIEKNKNEEVYVAKQELTPTSGWFRLT